LCSNLNGSKTYLSTPAKKVEHLLHSGNSAFIKLRVAALNTDDCIAAAVSQIKKARPESSKHPNLIGVASYAPTFRTPTSRAAGHGLIAKSSK